MKLTIDTAGATAFELTVLSNALAQLATAGNGNPDSRLVEVGARQAAPLSPSEAFENGNAEQINAALEAAELGNVPAASTDIPPAPVSAPVSESPSPAPAAPSVIPAAPASAPTVATRLDSAGFPWDARIHTANKAVIGDGTWRKKPGVATELVESVRAELKAGATPVTDVPAVPSVPNAAATGAIPAAPAPDNVPAAPTLTSQDVLARCTEIQMSDMNKGSALFQAIVASGVAGGPMALPAVTDPAVLAACLAAVNVVAAA